jgi:hypothetical protein
LAVVVGDNSITLKHPTVLVERQSSLVAKPFYLFCVRGLPIPSNFFLASLRFDIWTTSLNVRNIKLRIHQLEPVFANCKTLKQFFSF